MRLLLASLLLAAPAAGCMLDDGGAPEPPQPPTVTTGAYHHFVQTGWVVPTTRIEADAVAFDVDERGSTHDNLVGALIAALHGIGLDVQLANRESFDSGAVVVLHSVRADSLTDDGTVTWRILDGLSDGAPRFDGTDRLTAISDDGLLSGSIRGGVLTGGFGSMTVRVPLFPDQPPLRLPLVAARVEMTPGEVAHGRVGGAIRPAELDTVLAQLGDEVVEHMARHPEHAFTASARSFFDANNDGTVTSVEVATFARSLMAPDLDLDGDGERDALSVALGFEAVPAEFTAVE